MFGGGFARLKAIDDGPRDYTRYGFRVPAVIVSPYARPDYVCSKTLDHTSVLKLIEEKWNLPPLTRRDAAAESPLDALDLDGEPAFAKPPNCRSPRCAGAPGAASRGGDRFRDLKWSSVRRTQHTDHAGQGYTGELTAADPTGHGGSHLTRAVTMARSG